MRAKIMCTKQCSKCKETKNVSEFYSSKTHSQGVMTYCKACFNQKCMIRWANIKTKAIQYLGNKCVDCGLEHPTTHSSVFDFHHLHSKDYDWTKLRLKSWSSITEELDKCVLLCANCHRLRHYS
jgi:hypothetical protein